MKYVVIFFILIVNSLQGQVTKMDWLIHNIPQKTSVKEENKFLVIENGLLRRSFYKGNNIACFDFTNLANDQQLIRAIKPEARLIIDHNEYQIGG
ncbi:MAG: alpha-galactosidase, partial [Bacteroidetes bacterium]|nr:alpha-galactosidase [Bacteroidota bacterium]